MPLKPSPALERTIKVINECLGFAGVTYWLSFGGLFALIRNNGVIPDGDFDICVHYGADWRRIERAFKGFGMEMSKGILDDSTGEMLYCGFNHTGGNPERPKFTHICLSFWKFARGLRWYCHDQQGEMKIGQVGVPASGYYLKGVPDWIVGEDAPFKWVEWPGICGKTKIRVPVYGGALLDATYIGWAYKWQRYNVLANNVEPEKMESYYHGGGISRDMVHLKTMADMQDDRRYEEAHKEGARKYAVKLKEILKKQ
jgi:hypothetical protein